MAPPITLALIAGATSWATIGIATFTGLVGLASGAAAAAYVTTSHERAERFRDRMIDAADAFLGNLVKSEAAVETTFKQTQEFATLRGQRRRELEKTSQQSAAVEDTEETQIKKAEDFEKEAEKLKRRLDATYMLLSEMQGLLPRLYVVFREESVGNLARRLHLTLTNRVHAARAEFEESTFLRENERQNTFLRENERQNYFHQDLKLANIQEEVKPKLLRSFNRSIRKRRL
jgi:predicted ribosome quality control (RQC) complex YloA/Tae2 family protein